MIRFPAVGGRTRLILPGGHFGRRRAKRVIGKQQFSGGVEEPASKRPPKRFVINTTSRNKTNHRINP